MQFYGYIYRVTCTTNGKACREKICHENCTSEPRPSPLLTPSSGWWGLAALIGTMALVLGLMLLTK
jgi:hypothetical protein